MTDVPPLIAEAMKKAGLVWVSAHGRAQGAWHVWSDGVLYLLTGPGEQPLPDLADGEICAVTVPSADTGGRIVTWTGAVSRVQPPSETWQRVVPLLHAARLNLPDGPTAEERWSRECTVFAVEPTGEILAAGATLPADSGAAAPRPTPATSRVPIPYTVGRGRRQRRRAARH